jgi:ABC-type multidrug transport system permease subunit
MIDARGPRWSAGLTSIVLVIALLTRSPIVMAIQLVQFGFGAFAGLPRSPYARLYKSLVQPRLSKDFDSEDVRPPQFAQLVGFAFALTALVGALTHTWPLFTVATGFALFAAFLNSAFGYCLGCKVYLLGVRIRSV